MLCKALLAQREAAELTQRALAAKLDKPHSFVAKVEHGDRRIDPVEFVEWCRACGADPAKEILRIRV
ncbi:MAG: transcriptional regulator [Euryarchaeota archaeon]|nr:transcriptional regulator [Porticoccaceae bacterium]MBE02062.1 transcriptional regulator [Marinobacter sp.]|tara:strand:- start:24032 stop:24232 length:201 start_codon:yes stop_codon:yes gene_type:complete